MIGKTIQTRAVLSEQDFESRRRNVQCELFRQLEMNFGIESPHPADRLADLGLSGTVRESLCKTIERHFPFIHSGGGGAAIVERSENLYDLVRFILEKI